MSMASAGWDIVSTYLAYVDTFELAHDSQKQHQGDTLKLILEP
jgi:hypothetical protein